MSTDLAIRDKQELVRLDNEQIKFLAQTEFVQPAMRGNLPAIFACIATGREIGIGDMAALRHIHVIDGKPGYSAEIMVVLARRAGHSITGEVGEGSATVRGRRADNGDEMTATWTLAMADRAGLLNKQNWKRYPESMLWARAVSQLCRELFADCFAGATYTQEELGEETLVGEPQTEAALGVTSAPDSQIASASPDVSASPTIDDPAAGTPFSYDHEEPLDPPLDQVFNQMPSEAPLSPVGPPASEGAPSITEAQKKKANVLVGKLRPDHISTLQLWQSMGREPVPSEDGLLHWSPLRDSLSKSEAHELIDRLQAFADDKLGAAA